MSSEPPPVLSYQADTSTVSRWDIAFLGCRLFAVYCVIQVATSLASVGMVIGGRFDGATLLWIGLALAMHAGATIVLWTQAGRFASWMLSDAGAAGASAGPATASIQSIAISLIGLFLAALALPRTLAALAQLLGSGGLSAYPGQGYYILQSFIELVVGMALFFGAKGLSHLWYRARTAGIRPPERADAQNSSESE